MKALAVNRAKLAPLAQLAQLAHKAQKGRKVLKACKASQVSLDQRDQPDQLDRKALPDRKARKVLQAFHLRTSPMVSFRSTCADPRGRKNACWVRWVPPVAR